MNKQNLKKLLSDTSGKFNSIILKKINKYHQNFREEMKLQIERLLQRRSITLSNRKIYYETDAAILIELEEQSVWLSKKDITIQRDEDTATITIPYWLLKKKLPSDKLRYYCAN